MDAEHWNRATDPVQDLAVEWVEQELGRHDFYRNWSVFKTKFPENRARHDRVREWMQRIGLDGDPQAVLDRVEALSQDSGWWH